ncbi:MAG TPA: SigE family RNA polymerase sigma factor [Actinocrinis sp.]|nr:SigE family RNA polymerase sigma factor [Actinocrinis sp.]
MTDRSEYQQFVQARAGNLFRVAYLMCGDWHEAQDLVQATLVKLYVAWNQIERREGAEAYARKVLLRTYLSSRRLRRSGERPVADLGTVLAKTTDHDLRLTLVAALKQLPARNRAVLVLRYLEDLSIEGVAEVLDVSPAAVKSLNTRSLARLRELLGDDRQLLFGR